MTSNKMKTMGNLIYSFPTPALSGSGSKGLISA